MKLKEFDSLYNKFHLSFKNSGKQDIYKNLFYEKPSKSQFDLETYYSELKEKFTNEFGVIGGGIGLLDITKKETELLFGRNLKKNLFNQKIDKTEILDFEYPTFQPYNELINLSFFAIRNPETTAIPEYIKLLNIENPSCDNLQNHNFLKQNKFIWINHNEIKSALDEYHILISTFLNNNKICSYQDLLGNLDVNQNFIDDSLKLIINYIEKSENQIKTNLIESLEEYISSIKLVKTSSLLDDMLSQKIKALVGNANFPVLSYSIIYTFKGSSANYSHIVFPLWNTFSEHYTYQYNENYKNKSTNESKKEYSLVHGLYTIDNNRVELNEDNLISFKLILRQFVEPIIDKEHYKKIRDIDIDKINLQSKRNRKLDLAAYNISHTYSSHVFPFIEKFLNQLQEHIYKLYESKHFNKEELNWFKEYHQKQLEKFTRLAINLASANERFNKETSQMFFSTYKAKNLFNKKIAEGCLSNLDSGDISYINALGLGITDGDAFCILRHATGHSKDIALPYGEVGVTMLLMLIANLFRNLKKHSKSESLAKDFKDEIQYLKEYKIISDIKDNYQIDVRVEDIEAEAGETEFHTRFRNEYLKVRFVETSREYVDNEKIRFEGEDLLLSKVIKRLNEKLNDWSEENQDNWKGLKEIRMIASVLIGCPIEEIDFNNHSSNIIEHKGQVYPKQLVTYEVINNQFHHNIYLKKPKFGTVWINNENDITPEKAGSWANKGIAIKVNGIDKPEPLNSVPFVVDCNSGRFDKVKHQSLYYNFRFIKTDLEEIINCKVVTKKIKELWFLENPLLQHIQQSKYIKYNSSNNKIDCNETVFHLLPNNSTKSKPKDKGIALIDEHFRYLPHHTDKVKDYSFIESNSTKALNDEMKKKNKDLEYLQRETVNTKVVLYDEVISKMVDGKKDKDWQDKDFAEVLGWKNIIIEKSITIKDTSEPLNVAFGGEGKSTLPDLIENLNKNHSDHCDRISYFLIHYSGFEKLSNRTDVQIFNEYFKDENLNYIDLSPKNKFAYAYKYLVDKLNCMRNSTYVVLCSGKYPNLLPDRAYFIDRQSLKHCILDISSKIHLIKQLSSLRIQNYKENEKKTVNTN